MRKIILAALSFLWIYAQPVAASFGGAIYDDPLAQPAGLGGTDSRCVGSPDIPVSGVGFKIRSLRSGENNTGTVIGNSYSVATYTKQGDYTVVVNLPYPPPDPANAWQCACNANPLDAYQCVYTNQDPTMGGSLNVFVKRANVQNNAWWQVLGGNVFSKYNIQSLIPVSLANTPGYCNTTAGCLPALIGSNPSVTADTPGFAFSTDGIIYTHETGTQFIHQAGQRNTSLDGFALQAELPTENYAYFAKKLLQKAQPLPSSQKPQPAAQPGIYAHEGSLTIGAANQWHLTASEQLIVFITGDLIIDDTPGAENRLITVERGGQGFLSFIVQGNIIVTPNVGYANLGVNTADPNIPVIEGVFVADGIIQIQSYLTAADRKFIGAGTFVGWSGVDLQRSFAQPGNNAFNNIAPAETFVFRPDFLVNTPGSMKTAHFNIREIQPQQLQ